MSGSVLSTIAQGVNPLQMQSQLQQLQTQQIAAQQAQFNLQQARLQPAYQSMRQLLATNPNASWGDVTNALGASKRIGGNVDGLIANANDAAAAGGSAADFMRATALGGMSPFEQLNMIAPSVEMVRTPQGLQPMTVGGVMGPHPGQATPSSGFIPFGISPEQWAAPTIITDPTTGRQTEVPFGQKWGIPKPTGLGGGDGSATTATTQSAPAATTATPVATSKDDFITKFTPIAQQISQRTGLPVDYLLAQAGMESGWGTSRGFQNNNFFGISPGGKVASYATPQAGIDAYVALMNGPRYGGVSREGTPQQIGDNMASAGYNPFPGYGAKVGGFASHLPPTGSTPQGDVFIGQAVSGPGQPGGVAPPGPAGTYTPRSYALPPPGLVPSIEAAADASTKQYTADNAAAGQFNQRLWPLVNAQHIIDTQGTTTGPGAAAARDIIGHLQTLTSIFTPADLQTIGQAKFEELNKYLTQAVNAQPFAQQSDARLASAITGNPSAHISTMANADILKAMIALERMKQAAITDFNNQGGQPMNYANFLRQWQTTHDPRAFVFDMLNQDQRQKLVTGMNPTERQNFANTLTFLQNNPGLLTRAAMP